MADDTDTLEALLARVRAGDADALTDLLRRYEPRVRLAARSLLRPHLRHLLDSIDLVQSVHRALLPGLREGRYAIADEGHLLALALTVLRNKFLRSAKRATRLPASAGDVEQLPASDALAPEHAAVANDEFRGLTAGLDADDRRLLELRAGDHSTAEIAAMLGCTPAVLRARLSRLRKRLRPDGD